jgi:hypothetical protein
MEVMEAIHMAANMAVEGMEIMQAMDIASDPASTRMLAVIIVTDGLIMAITTPTLALDFPFFGVDPAFGTGQPGSRRSGSVAFTGDLALALSSCPNGKLQDGILLVLPRATLCSILLFQLSRFPWLCKLIWHRLLIKMMQTIATKYTIALKMRDWTAAKAS